MKNYFVYKHTCQNGKTYIGITSQKPQNRWDNGNGYKRNVLFNRAINKYGWGNIQHEILFEGLTKEQAEKKEIELIALYKSNNKNYGYNIASGGYANQMTEETKKKLSLSLIGKGTGKRKPMSEETKNIFRVSFKGKHFSKNTEFKKGTSIHYDNSKKVEVLKNGVVVGQYKSISETAKELNLCLQSVSKCCRGIRKTTKGLTFRFAEV